MLLSAGKCAAVCTACAANVAVRSAGEAPSPQHKSTLKPNHLEFCATFVGGRQPARAACCTTRRGALTRRPRHAKTRQKHTLAARSAPSVCICRVVCGPPRPLRPRASRAASARSFHPSAWPWHSRERSPPLRCTAGAHPAVAQRSHRRLAGCVCAQRAAQPRCSAVRRRGGSRARARGGRPCWARVRWRRWPRSAGQRRLRCVAWQSPSTRHCRRVPRAQVPASSLSLSASRDPMAGMARCRRGEREGCSSIGRIARGGC